MCPRGIDRFGGLRSTCRPAACLSPAPRTGSAPPRGVGPFVIGSSKTAARPNELASPDGKSGESAEATAKLVGPNRATVERAWELNGDPVTPIHPARPLHKVISRGGSFGEATDRPSVRHFAWLVGNLERLVEKLEYHEVRAGRVAVWLGYKDGRFGEGRANPGAPTDRFDVLLDTLRPCLRRAWIPRASAQRMHLFAESLRPRNRSQLGLFDLPGERAEAIARLKRKVNARHGRFALRSAATLPLASIYRHTSNEYDICDVRGKMCF